MFAMSDKNKKYPIYASATYKNFIQLLHKIVWVIFGIKKWCKR